MTTTTDSKNLLKLKLRLLGLGLDNSKQKIESKIKQTLCCQNIERRIKSKIKNVKSVSISSQNIRPVAIKWIKNHGNIFASLDNMLDTGLGTDNTLTW